MSDTLSLKKTVYLRTDKLWFVLFNDFFKAEKK